MSTRFDLIIGNFGDNYAAFLGARAQAHVTGRSEELERIAAHIRTTREVKSTQWLLPAISAELDALAKASRAGGTKD